MLRDASSPGIPQPYPLSTRLFFFLTWICAITRSYDPRLVLQKEHPQAAGMLGVVKDFLHKIHVCFILSALIGYPATSCMSLIESSSAERAVSLNAPCVFISGSLGGYTLFCWAFVRFFVWRGWQIGPGLNVTAAFSHRISHTSWLVVSAQLCLGVLTLVDTLLYLAVIDQNFNAPEVIAYICRNISVYPAAALALFFSLSCDHFRRHARLLRGQISTMGKLRVSMSMNDEEEGAEAGMGVEEDESLLSSAAGQQDLSDRLLSLKRELLSLKDRFMVYLAVQNMTIFVYTVFKVFVLWVEIDNYSFLDGAISFSYLVLMNGTTLAVNFSGAAVSTAVQNIYYAALESSSPCLNGAKALNTNPDLAMSLFGFQLTKNNVVRMVYFVGSGSYIFLQAAIRYAL